MQQSGGLHRRCALLGGLCASASVALLCGLMGFTREVGYHLIWLLMLAVLWYAGTQFFSESDRRAQVCFGVLGALFSLSMALGLRLDAFEETGWDGLAMSLLIALAAGPAVGEGFVWLYRGLCRLKPATAPANTRRVFWLSFATLLLCWLPVLLAYWPGVYAYDLDSQVSQVIYHSYTTHHPLLHTLVVGGFYKLGELMGSHNIGALMYVVFQMSCLALSLSYGLSYLARLRCPRVLRLVLLGIFGLAPHHSLLAIGCTKDVLFAACALVLMVQLHQLYRDPSLLRRKGFMASLALMVLFFCQLRNNAIFAVVLLLPIGALLLARDMRGRLCLLLCIGMVSSLGLNAGLKAVTDADSGSIVEAFSIPAQQLSRVYTKYGYDHLVSYEIEESVPNAYRYRPERSDFVKLHLVVNTPQRLLKLCKLWVREFFHYPVEYVDAFLYNTKGFWYVDDLSFASIYSEGLELRTGVIITEMYTQLDVEHTSLFPALESLYEQLFSANEYQRIPILSLLLHPALYTWLLLFCLCIGIYRRDRAVCAVCTVLTAYLATLFFGPCALVRYSYYLMVCIPVLLGVLASPREATLPSGETEVASKLNA